MGDAESPKKALVPLIVHNEKLAKLFDERDKTNVPNGLACPNCQNELVDVNPTIRIRAQRLRVEVACPKCHYIGQRYLKPEEITL